MQIGTPAQGQALMKKSVQQTILNNPQSQPEDMSDQPDWSDDFFTTVRLKRTLTRQQKRQERQFHARWGATIPLDGRVEQMRKAQEDPSLRTIRRKYDSGEGPYIKTNGLIYRTARLPNRLEESTQLQPYDYKVTHQPGKDNRNANGLSRQAWEEDEDPDTLQGEKGVLEIFQPRRTPTSATGLTETDRQHS